MNANDLYVTITPKTVKAVNQNTTEFQQWGSPENLFAAFWDWFNGTWSVADPDATVHLKKGV
jgi:hypothetical protein